MWLCGSMIIYYVVVWQHGYLLCGCVAAWLFIMWLCGSMVIYYVVVWQHAYLLFIIIKTYLMAVLPPAC
jgi:hypothetical protein